MSSCTEQKCQETYAKMKALRKCLKEEVETNKKLSERVKEVEDTLQSKDDTLESLQMNNQRLVLRIETLQQKKGTVEPQQPASGGWGSGLFGASTAVTQELEAAKQALEVAQEELEAKMAENQHVHELNFEVKRKYDNIIDSMGDIEKQHNDKIAELDSLILEKDGVNKNLTEQLESEKRLSEKTETQRSDLLKKYEAEKADWVDVRNKIEGRLTKQQGQFRSRIPFDPFGQDQFNILNAIKSDGKTRDKQIEIVQSLKQLADPTQALSLADGFESLFIALKNLSDGSMPVFNNEFSNLDQDADY